MYNLFLLKGSIEILEIEKFNLVEIIEKVYEIVMKIYILKEE